MLIKLKTTNNNTILIGTESIISVEKFKPTEFSKIKTGTIIKSRGAMIEQYHVKETVEEIYQLSQPIDIETLNAKIFNLQEQLKIAKEIYFNRGI